MSSANGPKHGEKMIEVRLRFWTNNIAPQKGQIVAKHAWDKGVAVISANPSHGIESAKPINFNSILEIPQVLGRVLEKSGVTLHAGHELRRLIKDPPKKLIAKSRGRSRL
jgi:hypothetical protein